MLRFFLIGTLIVLFLPIFLNGSLTYAQDDPDSLICPPKCKTDCTDTLISCECLKKYAKEKYCMEVFQPSINPKPIRGRLRFYPDDCDCKKAKHGKNKKWYETNCMIWLVKFDGVDSTFVHCSKITRIRETKCPEEGGSTSTYGKK